MIVACVLFFLGLAGEHSVTPGVDDLGGRIGARFRIGDPRCTVCPVVGPRWDAQFVVGAKGLERKGKGVRGGRASARFTAHGHKKVRCTVAVGFQ